MRDRSFRRWQQCRATNRAARYLKWLFANRPEMVTPHRIARFAVDRTPCSCAMCGNPRRYLGERTRQEAMSDAELLQVQGTDGI